MKSPRFGESGPHQRTNTLGWLVALATVLIAMPCRAQSTGGAVRDSAAAVRPDSARADSARADSASAGSASADTAGTDTAGTDTAGTDTAGTDTAGTDTAGTDTTAVAPGDSLARPGATSATPPGSAAPPPAPVDSALGAACEETSNGPPDVLLVTFVPSATESERAAVAKEVGGTLLGMSEHAAPGSWYLQVPGSGVDPAIADRLILLAPVSEVGSTRCPS